MPKHNDLYGPWSMSMAQKCHLDSFWKKRFDGLSNMRPNPSRKDWLFGLGMLAMIVLLPSLQLEPSNVIAEERPINVSAPAPTSTVAPDPAKHTIAQPISRVAPILLAESQQLQPNELTLSMNVGQTHKLGMPKDCKVTVGAPDIFSAATDDEGDVTIHPKKSGEGILKFEFENRASFEMKIVVLIDPSPLTKSLQQNGLNRIAVEPLNNSVVLTGQVPTIAEMKKCIELAEGLYPKVINNLTVGGQQQVELHCKVFDFEADEAKLTAAIEEISAGRNKSVTDDTTSVLLNGDAFDSIPKNLRKKLNAAAIAAPTLTTVSGRPAALSTGGEFPILIPQGPKTVAVEFKQFGTRVDFVPVTLGNDRLRLDVRTQISQIEPGNPPVKVGNSEIPRLNKRWADLAVEMNSGQTLAIAVVDKRPGGKRRCFLTLVRPELVSSVVANSVRIAPKSVPMLPRFR